MLLHKFTKFFAMFEAAVRTSCLESSFISPHLSGADSEHSVHNRCISEII